MSNKSKRVCFSPHVNDIPTIFLKKKREIGNGNFKLTKEKSRLAPLKFLVKLGTKVASSIRSVSMKRRSSRKVSSSSTLVRSRSISDLTDSHRAETVEDCIEFLHSSSTRERPSFS
ncbi:unnamed protein product [Trifolium pratense]|uniref:Uncharacterized protein n=1 Tax=Trifolium pratense TaxID=57577 RepID=A0ACB0LQR5_TRIPR|nr:unnamed protein product [Trifolium pratense]